MNLKIIILIFILVIQLTSVLVSFKDKLLLPYIILNIYTVKPIIESYLPILDSFLQVLMLLGIIFEFAKVIKKKTFVKYNKYLLVFLLLIIVNGLYNSLKGNMVNRLYLQGFLNYSYIFLIIIYLMNVINDKLEFKNMLGITKYNGILLFLFSLYDKFVMKLVRTGDLVNTNYISQMSLILLLFYVYSTKRIWSFRSMIYYIMLLFTIISTGSSSGKLALLIIGLSVVLFNLESKLLVNLSNYVFFGVIFFFMFVVIFTSNSNLGLLKFFVKSKDISRVVLWQYTFNSIKANPLMGGLYNTFRAPWENITMVTHNDFLRILAELGIGGIVVLLIFVTVQINRLSYYSKMDGFFLYSLIMITLSFSLSHNNINNLMFWLVLTLPSFKLFDNKNE